MKTVAVVPVNSLARTKSRLSDLLAPDERAALTTEMLFQVAEALKQSGVIEQVAIITGDPALDRVPQGVTLLQQDRAGLNELLEQGREWAIERGADALMVVFSDLPLITPQDARDIVRAGEQGNTVVLAPDRHGHGTNVLLTHPVALAPFSFGTGSYDRHRALALQAGARVETYLALGTGLDVDTPDDLELMESERITALGIGV